MVQNKKIGVGMALIAGVIGMCASGAASALPEMDVDTVPPIVAPQSVDTVDIIVDESDEIGTPADAS